MGGSPYRSNALFDAPFEAHQPLAILQQQCRDEVARWIGRGNALLARQVAVPDICFGLRGRSAGMVRFEGSALRRRVRDLRINAELLQRYPEEMLQQTVPHEVAHILVAANWRGSVRPHGPEWQWVMRAFGKDAQRCHTMRTTPARTMRTVAAYCGCATAHQIGPQRSARLSRGSARYQCTQCGEWLRLKR